jgi:hypothetical protein
MGCSEHTNAHSFSSFPTYISIKGMAQQARVISRHAGQGGMATWPDDSSSSEDDAYAQARKNPLPLRRTHAATAATAEQFLAASNGSSGDNGQRLLYNNS